MGCQPFAGLPPALTPLVPIYAPGWRDLLGQFQVSHPKTQYNDLEPGPPDIKSSQVRRANHRATSK